MKRRYSLLLIAFLITSWGCGKETKTITLQPTVLDTLEFNEHDESEYSCWPATCFYSHGYSCLTTVDTTKQIEVGFHYKYEPGTKPCNCWWYKDCVFRGGVRFDLGALQGKNIIDAKLKWTERGPCAANLYVPNKDWGTFGLSTSGQIQSPWPANSSGAGEINVGNTVRDWVLGNAPNHGWIFTGDETESFPNKGWIEGDAEIGPGNSNSKCTSAVGGFTLEVKFTE